MSDDPSTIGLQHPAFAVSKNVLLSWLNDFFELNYVKVEECASGAIYCQILDCIYPGKVPMSRVDWTARSEYQFVNNFKIVQKVMNAQNITKPVHIDKLVKAKYQDNLEFLQWFKHFFECRYGGQAYNAKDRRKGKKGVKKVAGESKRPSAAGGVSASSKATTSSTRPTSARPKPAAAKKDSASAAQVKELTEQIAALQATVEGLEKERDFYFGKLREVEVLCQSEEPIDDLKASVLGILYKTDDDEGDEEAGEAAEADGDDETF